jgi:hypothetical protein|tara:strand:+ start:882 stop:1217 length:336 start_codon:yes stop_codon:yes gene_type:complete
MSAFYMWSNSFQEIPLIVYTDESRSVLVDPTTYVEAEYRIYTKDTCTEVFSASLGYGIAIDGIQLVLTTTETDITFFGEYDHVFRYALSAGQLAPPAFEGVLTVFEVCGMT